MPLLQRTTYPKHVRSLAHYANSRCRIVKGVSVLPQRVTSFSSNTLRSSMFAATAAKVEDEHVDGMCSSKTSSSNASAAATELETSAAATHVKGVRDAENLCAMASARTWCDEGVAALARDTCSGKVRVEKCSHGMGLLIFRASPSKQITAHSSHHCLRLRESATTRDFTRCV